MLFSHGSEPDLFLHCKSKVFERLHFVYGLMMFYKLVVCLALLHLTIGFNFHLILNGFSSKYSDLTLWMGYIACVKLEYYNANVSVYFCFQQF